MLFQPQPQHTNNNWNMMTPEQQILFLNMRLAHQRPPGPPQPVDYRIGNSNDFYQAPPVAPQQEIDPIQQLLMQLQKTGGQENQQQQQWMKPAAVPEVLNHNPSSIPVNNWNQQQHQQAPPINMWDNIDQTSQSLQIEPQEKKEINAPLPENEKEKVNGVIDQQHHLQHQFQAAPSSKGNKKKQREAQIKEANAPLPKQNQQPQQVKKKPNDKPREKKEERTTQPAAPAPWVGHQTQASGANLAKIQKTETQRRQEIQREREIVKNIDPKPDKKDVLNWVSAPSARVKTLDEIQAEEQVQSTAANAKREAAKKEAAAVVSSEAIIWNATPHSMAWQQPKVWSGEQTSGSGFWEEPTKPTSTVGPTKMLSKSQTMVSIATNKKPSVLQPSVKKQVPSSKKTAFVGEKKEKKDENNNEFTFWCTRTLGQMNGNVDGNYSTFQCIKFITLTNILNRSANFREFLAGYRVAFRG